MVDERGFDQSRAGHNAKIDGEGVRVSCVEPSSERRTTQELPDRPAGKADDRGHPTSDAVPKMLCEFSVGVHHRGIERERRNDAPHRSFRNGHGSECCALVSDGGATVARTTAAVPAPAADGDETDEDATTPRNNMSEACDAASRVDATGATSAN